MRSPCLFNKNRSYAKVCLMPPMHFKFYGCRESDCCHSKSVPSIKKIFALKILDNESDVIESKRIGAAVGATVRDRRMQKRTDGRTYSEYHKDFVMCKTSRTTLS